MQQKVRMSTVLEVKKCGKLPGNFVQRRVKKTLKRGSVLVDDTHTYVLKKKAKKDEGFNVLHVQGTNECFVLRDGCKKTYIYMVNCDDSKKAANVQYMMRGNNLMLLVLKDIGPNEELRACYNYANRQMYR
jgi:hypothetical protein